MDATPFRVGLVQTNSTDDMAENIAAVTPMIGMAASQGADFILLPECVSLMEPRGAELLRKTFAEGEDPALAAFRAAAAQYGKWLLIGSLPIRVAERKVANRSFLIGPDGEIRARYDKIHLFDVDLPNGETFRESKLYQPGDAACMADLPWGRLGMTVCYDLRFPHLFRALGQAGASFLTVPAAFTRLTGQAHWHVLLRARAIETGCYVFAPAQTGTHAMGRETFGHSLVINPWGDILADAGEYPGIVIADIDPKLVETVHGRIPSLLHDRVFTPPAPAAASSQ